MGPKSAKIPIGELLIQSGQITREQLDLALAEQKKSGTKLGKTLVKLGFIDEQILLNFLSQQLKLPFIDLRYYSVNMELARKLPENIARRFRSIVLADDPDGMLVGMADPLDIHAIDELVRILHRPILPAFVHETDLLEALDGIYRSIGQDIESYAKELSEELYSAEIDLAGLAEQSNVAEAPVVKLLQSIFEDAIQIRASDIHIEPGESVLRIRQRVDGELQEHFVKDVRIAPALAQRLKLMAKLNITERRTPQDGRFTIKIDSKVVDVRLSTMPIQFGESLVMRLLVRTDAINTFAQLGIPKNIVDSLNKLIHLPYGMFLVTGPTGSGKTTTLYSVLNEINTENKKIITVEDPVEYHLQRINQVQVNPYVDLDFARVLRAALRQDPDVIMIGEVRDMETSNIAIRAALTGHLVLATLHTNDAISSAIRLIDMGNEGFLVAAALRAVLAQRLIRRICQNCTEPYEPTPEEKAWLSVLAQKKQFDPTGFKKGKGCLKCNKTGYKGRSGVYELLILDKGMIDAMAQQDVKKFSELANANKNFVPLQIGALEMALQGITTLEEVITVAMESEDVSRIANL